MKEFKIRASQIGKIMTEPRSKADKEAGNLSETVKTYCETWLKEQLYERKKDISTKFTEKGNIVEDNSIDFIAEQLGYPLLIKNSTYHENEYITGTPDIDIKGEKLVIDAKNSWDFSTFPLFETEIPNKDYTWQGQGYMDLLGYERFKLVYVLSDTPLNLIEKEAYWWCKNNGFDELDMDVFQEFEKKMTYPDIPNQYKIKVFDLSRSESDIQAVYRRVERCREYINELKKRI